MSRRDECFTAIVGAGRTTATASAIRVSSLQIQARALIGTGFPFKQQTCSTVTRSNSSPLAGILRESDERVRLRSI